MWKDQVISAVQGLNRGLHREIASEIQRRFQICTEMLKNLVRRRCLKRVSSGSVGELTRATAKEQHRHQVSVAHMAEPAPAT